VIRNYGTEVVIYTDGSATDGSKNGGAVVTTRGDPVSPDVICMEQKRGTACTSSFEEEKEAESMAITWASSNCCEALISSVSQSLLRAIASDIESVADIIHLLRQSSVDTLTQCVPEHCGLTCNESADERATPDCCI